MGDRGGFLQNLPTQNKDNFRIYHEGKPINNINSKQNAQHKNSIYPTTSDTPLEQRIVNEPKPQVTLKYLRIRGSQYSSLTQSSERTSAKRKRTNGAKAQP